MNLGAPPGIESRTTLNAQWSRNSWFITTFVIFKSIKESGSSFKSKLSSCFSFVLVRFLFLNIVGEFLSFSPFPISIHGLTSILGFILINSLSSLYFYSLFPTGFLLMLPGVSSVPFLCTESYSSPPVEGFQSFCLTSFLYLRFHTIEQNAVYRVFFFF